LGAEPPHAGGAPTLLDADGNWITAFMPGRTTRPLQADASKAPEKDLTPSYWKLFHWPGFVSKAGIGGAMIATSSLRSAIISRYTGTARPERPARFVDTGPRKR
jgi:hypothetical protein